MTRSRHDTKVKDSPSPDRAFISDLTELRARAREHIMKGAVTPRYPEADRKAVVELVDLLEDLPKD